MTAKSGDLVIVDLGNSGGHEQAGRRPAIVVSVTNQIAIVIPLTSNTSALRFAAVHLISPNKKNGLDCDSTALIFQLRAIDVRRVDERIGSLDVRDKREINTLLQSVARIA